jgi:hypothetical protein
MKSAWLKLRRSRYFIGPYSDTPDITVMGPPPYFVLCRGALRMNWAGRFAWRLTHLSTRLFPGIAPFGLPKIGRSNLLGSQASKIVAPLSVVREL